MGMPGDESGTHQASGCQSMVAAGCIACIACIAGGAGSVDLATLMPLCARLTPRIERHPGALLLDLTGSERLLLEQAYPRHGATHAAAEWPLMARRLHQLLAAASMDASVDAGAPRVAVAPGRSVAWLAAQTPGPSWRVVAPRQITSFLHPLPVEALLTLPDLAQMPGALLAVAALRQGGIHTLGQLARLAPRALRARFGALGMALARLALGQDLAPLRVAPSPERLGARLRLDPPVALDHLAGVLDHLAAYLERALRQRRQEASEVLLVVRIEGQAPWRATHHLGHATANRGALFDHARRLAERMETERMGGRDAALPGASAIHLRVGELRPARPRQTALWPAHDKQQAHQVAQRLAGQHRSATLWRAVLAAPYAVLPEERYIIQSVTSQSVTSQSVTSQSVTSRARTSR